MRRSFWPRRATAKKQKEEPQKGLSAGEDTSILLFFAKSQERCKKVGIANGLKMLNLHVMEELVEGVQRKQVEQKPPSEPQSKEDAVKVQSADESEEPQESQLGRGGEQILRSRAALTSRFRQHAM